MKYRFIGAGNMGGAMARGLIKSGVSPKEISIWSRNIAIAENFKKLGCSIGDQEHVDFCFVAVKPWQIVDVVAIARKSSCIVSVAAGVDCEQLEEIFETKNIVRALPNTAVEFFEGVTFVAGNVDFTTDVADIFAELGKSFVVDQKLFDGCMALASCGIAYALRYARASQVGGVELGINPKLGQQIIAQTLKGAAAILENGNHPEAEIDKVTTPGGITIKGLNAMEKAGFTNAVIEGLKNSK